MLEVDLEPPYPVAINTYNLVRGNVMGALGFPILHSAVEILGREFAFGGHGYDETGVYCCRPRSLAGASFVEQIYVEHCFMSKEQVGAVILQTACRYLGNRYDILHFNCNDFTDELVFRLTGQHAPRRLNRAARVAGFFKRGHTTVSGELQETVKCQGRPGAQAAAEVKGSRDRMVL